MKSPIAAEVAQNQMVGKHPNSALPCVGDLSQKAEAKLVYPNRSNAAVRRSTSPW